MMLYSGNVHHLVGMAEVARMLGVSRQRVNDLTREDDTFPVPEAELAAGRIWAREAIEAWLASRARVVGGPARVAQVEGMVVVSPAEFAGIDAIVGPLRSGRVTVVDATACRKLDAKRCLDYAAGAAATAGMVVEDFGARCVVVRPDGVDLTAAQRRALRPYTAQRAAVDPKRRRYG